MALDTSHAIRIGLIRWSATLVLLLTFILGVLTSMTFPAPEPLPAGLHSPVIAMELPASAADVAQIVGELGDARRDGMRAINLVDFAFIASYTTLFVLIGTTLMPKRRPWSQQRRFAGVLLGTLTGLLDLTENGLILHVLATPLSNLDESSVSALRHVALAKWMLSFGTLGALAPLFFGLPRPAGGLAPIFLTSAFLGFVGALDPRFIEAASLPMILGLAILCYVAWRHPASVAGESRAD